MGMAVGRRMGYERRKSKDLRGRKWMVDEVAWV